MASLNVFQYLVESDAIIALKSINDSLGLPKNAGAQSYCDIEQFNGDGKFYIIADDVTESVLGNGFLVLTTNPARQ